MKLPYKFGKYVLTEKIAQGGMAEIYRAFYVGAGGFAKELAVKKILPELSKNPDFERMFVDEAKALVNLEHQNIVQVFELGEDDNSFYISMEFVNGVDLRRLHKKLKQREEKLSLRHILFIVSEVLTALSFAHNKKDKEGKLLNIVHRDISPANIMVSFCGAVKITDFGIAKGSHRTLETTVAQVKGKYAYMSPEQALGGDVDFRSDLFSCGIVLYELLTNEYLFEDENDFLTIENVKKAKILKTKLVGIEDELKTIVLKALQKDRSLRYQNAGEFLQAINAYAKKHDLICNSSDLASFLKETLREEILQAEQSAKLSEDLIKNSENIMEDVRQTRVVTTVADIVSQGAVQAYFKKLARLKKYLPLTVSILTPIVTLFLLFTYNHYVGAKIANATAQTKSDGQNDVAISAPIPTGSIAIDSFPSGTKGEIVYLGKTSSFTTPYIAKKLPLGSPIEGSFTIMRDGYYDVAEKFVITEDNPAFAKTYQLKSVGLGSVNIQAQPWGYAYIQNYIEGAETPISNVKVSAGRHIVKVFHQPTNQWLQRDITVASNKTINCIARFGKKSSMDCK